MTTFLEMTISLDGFVAAPGVSVEHPLGIGGERLHDWLFHGSDVDREVGAATFANTGAFLIGRRTFDVGIDAWGDDGTFGMPCFVVTHRPQEPLAKGPTTFTFVPDGVERAVALARDAAGERDVCVMGGAGLGQQVLAAGLADVLRIHVAPVLLGAGTRLFEHHGERRVELERTGVVETAAATHLSFRVADVTSPKASGEERARSPGRRNQSTVSRVTTYDEFGFGFSWFPEEALTRTAHALDTGDGVWLIDPVDVPDAIERARALGPPAGVIQLLDRHNRDCAALADRLNVPHLRLPEAVPGSPFTVVPVVKLPRWHEIALWWPERRALVVAELIGTNHVYRLGEGPAGMHPAMRALAPGALRAYQPEHLLVGHGRGVHGPLAAAALQDAYDRSRKDLPRLALKLPAMVKAVIATRR